MCEIHLYSILVNTKALFTAAVVSMLSQFRLSHAHARLLLRPLEQRAPHGHDQEIGALGVHLALVHLQDAATVGLAHGVQAPENIPCETESRRYFPRHNGWPHGCSYFSRFGQPLCPCIAH